MVREPINSLLYPAGRNDSLGKYLIKRSGCDYVFSFAAYFCVLKSLRIKRLLEFSARLTEGEGRKNGRREMSAVGTGLRDGDLRRLRAKRARKLRREPQSRQQRRETGWGALRDRSPKPKGGQSTALAQLSAIPAASPQCRRC